MILVDSSNLLHRTLHTPQADLTDSLGRYVGGVSGFITSLGATAARYRHQHLVVCCWDLGIPEFRREIYPEYKAHKIPTVDISITNRLEKDLLIKEGDASPDAFLDKYVMARRILHNDILPIMGGLSIQVENCEADDIIAYICSKITDEEIIILSSDRDFLQLLNDNIFWYDGRTKETLTVSDIIQKHNLIPERWRQHWIMARAISGDISDGIPGIEDIGFGSAVEYARQIVGEFWGLDLRDSLPKLTRVPRGRQTGYEALKSGEAYLKRNLKLIDLTLPIILNLPVVRDIRTQIASSFVYEIDQYKVELVLHEMGMMKTKLYANEIIDSNSKFDIQDYIRRLV
jgi:5'-3' exonuclease